MAKKRTIKSDDTKIVVAVTQRSERDVTKSFNSTNIDWSVIEKQLFQWGDLFLASKKLRVTISFNHQYIESGQASSGTNKRGASSTIQRMLTERTLQLNAEEEASGEPSIRRDVYKLMRCLGPPCNLGPYCWPDPIGKKRYRLRTHHFKSLIRYIEQGHKLETPDDVPEEIRQQLYAEGVAEHIIGDIDEWVKECKRAWTE